MDIKEKASFDEASIIFYDATNGIIFLHASSKAYEVCRVQKTKLDKIECHILTDNSFTQDHINIASITPFKGYSSDKYPFILIRTNRLYAMDTMTFEMIQFSQEDVRFKYDELYRGLPRNLVAVAENKFASFGLKTEKQGSTPQNSRLYKLEIKEDVLSEMKKFH